MRKGSKMSPEALKKMSIATKKLWESPDFRKKMSGRKGMTGKKHSPVTIAKMSEIKKGVLNPMFGKLVSGETRKKISQSGLGRKHTPETIEKMKSKKYTLESKEKLSNAAREAWDRPDVRKRTCDSIKKAMNVPETRRKLSEAACKGIQEGRRKAGVRGIQGGFLSKKNNKILHYRSLLELHWYQLLEQMSKVHRYYVEPVRIPYEWEGSTHHYLPDLRIRYTDGTTELVEIKPEYLWDDLQNQAKFKAARKWCKTRRVSTTFKVVGYEELN